MKEPQQTPANQDNYSSDQPEQVPVNNQPLPPAPSTLATKPDKKFTKKTKIITGVIVILLVLVGLVAYESKLASNYQTAYKQYITNPSYTYYANDMHTFLQSNNGVFSKMYNCTATATMVWNASNSTGSADAQYTSLQYKIKTDLQTAEKAQPAYHSFILASISPQARRAHTEYTDLNNLFVSSRSMSTESFANPTGINITPYCITRLYGPIIALKSLLKNPNTNPAVTLKQTIESEVQYVAKLKDNESPHITVPSSMTKTENLFANDFLTKMGIDLNAWIGIDNSSAQTGLSFDGLNTDFANDTNELNTIVMPEAALQSKNIQPSVDQLQTYLNNVATNN